MEKSFILKFYVSWTHSLNDFGNMEQMHRE